MPSPGGREVAGRDGGERSPLLGGTPLKGRRAACMAVLAVEGPERAAFFAAPSAWGGTQASRACLFFLGASYLLSPVGGWLADVYLGRYGTVVLSFLLYLLAACLLPVTASLDGRLSACGQLPAATIRNCSWHRGGTCRGQPPEQYCAPTIYSGLLLLALGVSSVRANLTPFGADQVRDQGGDATRRFFNWFYWSINIGAVFSLLVVAFVQQNISFLAGYLIPVACLALALLIFLLATPTFVTKPPTGSQVSAMIQLALQICGCTRMGDTGARGHRGPAMGSGGYPGPGRDRLLPGSGCWGWMGGGRGRQDREEGGPLPQGHPGWARARTGPRALPVTSSHVCPHVEPTSGARARPQEPSGLGRAWQSRSPPATPWWCPPTPHLHLPPSLLPLPWDGGRMRPAGGSRCHGTGAACLF
uniref:Solute carrier family 15 member 3 n=1 Tax=Accipiter nisus TaxID=211598 RepID=A0A8B9NFF5_9AVES